MSGVLDILKAAGIAVEVKYGGKLVLRGLASLPEDKAKDMIALAKENKDNILKVLDAICPYSEAQLEDFGRSHPHLVCCPETKTAWNWRYREDCGQCLTQTCRHRGLGNKGVLPSDFSDSAELPGWT